MRALEAAIGLLLPAVLAGCASYFGVRWNASAHAAQRIADRRGALLSRGSDLISAATTEVIDQLRREGLERNAVPERRAVIDASLGSWAELKKGLLAVGFQHPNDDLTDIAFAAEEAVDALLAAANQMLYIGVPYEPGATPPPVLELLEMLRNGRQHGPIALAPADISAHWDAYDELHQQAYDGLRAFKDALRLHATA